MWQRRASRKISWWTSHQRYHHRRYRFFCLYFSSYVLWVHTWVRDIKLDHVNWTRRGNLRLKLISVSKSQEKALFNLFFGLKSSHLPVQNISNVSITWPVTETSKWTGGKISKEAAAFVSPLMIVYFPAGAVTVDQALLHSVQDALRCFCIHGINVCGCMHPRPTPNVVWVLGWQCETVRSNSGRSLMSGVNEALISCFYRSWLWNWMLILIWLLQLKWLVCQIALQTRSLSVNQPIAKQEHFVCLFLNITVMTLGVTDGGDFVSETEQGLDTSDMVRILPLVLMHLKFILMDICRL